MQKTKPKALRVVTVIGTRPEAIKMAPVIRALCTDPDIEHHTLVTAQHRQMLDQVLRLFEIVPDRDLDLMLPGQDIATLTARIITAVSEALAEMAPDLVLVHGDTTTSMVASLSAFYNRIPVGHVEAGLRTHDKWAPWPEEANRRITGVLTDLHFAPTEGARVNLLNEGVEAAHISVTGNTVIDALLWVSARLDQVEASGSLDLGKLLAKNVREEPLEPSALEALDAVGAGERPLVLITGHRRESFGGGFERICEAIGQLAKRFPAAVFAYPVHLNPNVQEPVNRVLKGLDNVFLLPPLDYLPFVWLMRQARVILTDSGGIQEEAPSLGVPVLVMREVTERPEAIEAGTVALVGTDVARIVGGVATLLSDVDAHAKMARAVNPYGDGKAAERIQQRLLSWAAARPSQGDS